MVPGVCMVVITVVVMMVEVVVSSSKSPGIDDAFTATSLPGVPCSALSIEDFSLSLFPGIVASLGLLFKVGVTSPLSDCLEAGGVDVCTSVVVSDAMVIDRGGSSVLLLCVSAEGLRWMLGTCGWVRAAADGASVVVVGAATSENGGASLCGTSCVDGSWRRWELDDGIVGW